jgi:SAM-dependent methyltransferase
VDDQTIGQRDYRVNPPLSIAGSFTCTASAGKIGAVDRLLEETYRAEQQHFWYRGFRRFVRPLLVEATSGLDHPRLLDCGCGTGANLPFLGEFGEAFGFDLTWRGLEFGRASGRDRLVQASVTAIPVASGSVDVVASFDVLYCLPDEAERMAIQEMRRVLRPGGSLIVNVAALDILHGDHSILGGEVRRYTTRRLRGTLERLGFEVVRITYTNAVLFPILATLRLLQRFRGLPSPEQASGDFFLPPAPINALLAGALAAEARVVAAGIAMPVGSSVLCLARRTAGPSGSSA